MHGGCLERCQEPEATHAYGSGLAPGGWKPVPGNPAIVELHRLTPLTAPTRTASPLISEAMALTFSCVPFISVGYMRP